MAKNNEQPKEKFKTMIGGQALIEGIMMRGPEKDAIVIRGREGLTLEVSPRKLNPPKSFKNWPFLRGMFNFFDAQVTGVKALLHSADLSPDEEWSEEPSKLDAWLGSSYGRTELDAAPWKQDGDDFRGVIFTFRDSAEELDELKRRHNLKEGRVIPGLPSGWQEQIDTTRPIYTAPPRVLINWHLSDWGYDTRDLCWQA